MGPEPRGRDQPAGHRAPGRGAGPPGCPEPGLANRRVFGELLAAALASRSGAERPWPCSASTSTASRTSTTLWATRSATRCCARWPSGCARCVRESDTVARLGGDEFAVVQSGVRAARPAAALGAARIVDALGRPTSSTGIGDHRRQHRHRAVAPTDGVDPDQLLKNADLALYRAKAEGARPFRFFEPEMDARMQARRGLELDLREALGDRRVRAALSAAWSIVADGPDHRLRGAAALAASRRGAWSRRPSSSRSPRRPG